MEILLKVVCVVLCLYEILDMFVAARDENGPFWLRAACIVGDGIIMAVATRFLWFFGA